MALADLYRFGQGVTKNESEAYALFEQAADLDHPYAQFVIGEWMEHGNMVVQKNEKEAANYYSHAASAGHAEAQCNLACMYLDGRGVVQDVTHAVELLEKSSKQGHAEAQFQLGLYCQRSE